MSVMTSLIFFLKCKFIHFIYLKARATESTRQRSSVSGSLLKCLTQLGLGKAEVRRQELHVGLPSGSGDRNSISVSHVGGMNSST